MEILGDSNVGMFIKKHNRNHVANDSFLLKGLKAVECMKDLFQAGRMTVELKLKWYWRGRAARNIPCTAIKVSTERHKVSFLSQQCSAVNSSTIHLFQYNSKAITHYIVQIQHCGRNEHDFVGFCEKAVHLLQKGVLYLKIIISIIRPKYPLLIYLFKRSFSLSSPQ